MSGNTPPPPPLQELQSPKMPVLASLNISASSLDFIPREQAKSKDQVASCMLGILGGDTPTDGHMATEELYSVRTGHRQDMNRTLWTKVRPPRDVGGWAGCAPAPGWPRQRTSPSSLLIGDLPEPFAVAAPPTDFQQGPGLRVDVQNAPVPGLGKKEGGMCSVTKTSQWCPTAGTFLRVDLGPY